VSPIPVSYLRAHCFALLQSVERTGSTIRITRYGKPLAEIHPPPKDATEIERLRAERSARDLELLNKHADEMNAEAEEDLRFYDVPEGYVLKKIRVRKKKSRKRKRVRSGVTLKP
jgi:antitoxin (DNA-binding transcriptional repressor) of toxin-antitoxin stability system